MATRARRRNQDILVWARAAAVASATYGGLSAMGFSPVWGVATLALSAAVLTLVAVDLGILVAVVAMSLPLVAANPLVGLTFVILGVIAVRYLGADGGQVFFLLAASIAGAFLGPVWAAVLLAGFLLGPGEGALAAALASVGLQLLGLTMGRASVGATITGGHAGTRLLNFSSQPENFFGMAWLQKAFSGLDSSAVNSFMESFGAFNHGTALVVQPLLWAFTAGVVGMLTRGARRSGRGWISYAGMAAAVLIPAVGAALLSNAAGVPIGGGSIAVAVITSVAFAVAFAWVWDRVFTLEVVQIPKRTGSMAAEDADVDELLRLVATAEEKLATEHTTVKTVMITDMKSFSKMTEEDGSVLTAKAIQKHRDLLMPLIESHGGHGKSTGGDGLVAAFDSEEAAVSAAVEMQQALALHNSTHPDAREMTVRIGVAKGDIVLDKSGRPFIGSALNVAARVMNLADGGQAFVTSSVFSKAESAARGHSHGDFELKNIAKAVEIVELLWAEDQKPMDPRERITAA